LLAFNPEKGILLPNAFVFSLEATPTPNDNLEGAKIDPVGLRIVDDAEDCSTELGSAILLLILTQVSLIKEK